LRAEHKLRVFENRMLRKIFGLNRDKVTREWRKLPIEELHYQYTSLSNQMEMNEMSGTRGTYRGEERRT
jgi:hypothetical protein